MYFEHRAKTGNPVIDKLIEQTTDEQREIQYLNKEIQTLRAAVQSKQSRVNKINLRIAQVRERQRYLRPVNLAETNDQANIRDYPHETRHHSPTDLVCLQGGKP